MTYLKNFLFLNHICYIQKNIIAMRISHPIHFLLFTLIILALPQVVAGQKADRVERKAVSNLKNWVSPVSEWYLSAGLKIDSISLSEEKRELDIWFPQTLLYNPVREDTYNRLHNSLMNALGKKFKGYTVSMYTNGTRLENLIPNYFRYELPQDKTRIPLADNVRPVLVSRLNSPGAEKGLDGRYIALWHSHGYYFDIPLNRWEWQRAKLFGSVEDLSVMAYVIPYLTPMLENSGATVFLPRERDTQVNEVIVDNDRSSGNSGFILQDSGAAEDAGRGFLLKDTLFTGDNPFLMGTSLRINEGSAVYVPDIPEKGYYGVTVSYPRVPDNAGRVMIRVTHTGGNTDFIVDQSVGGGTWLWLGAFLFDTGTDSGRGSVTVSGYDGSPALLDAVRFGGGMGNVARRPAGPVIFNQRSVDAGSQPQMTDTDKPGLNYSWKLSGKPRFLEGARYWLQYAGMPDSIVYSPNRGKNDYNDDYMSRADWVNYLIQKRDATPQAGLETPPEVLPLATSETALETALKTLPETALEIALRTALETAPEAGMGIPVDLSLAFHTDAGITPDDSIIGTLGIYSTLSNQGKFPDGTSRLASRDLTDIVQTQIVEDVRVLFNPDWTRRGLWDKSYYEARKPDVPAMLLELLSHQNMADQSYGLDPRFRFHVSRAVYKGILRYLATASGTDYVVHPLPVSHMALTPLDGKSVRLSWAPVYDPLESTAAPSSYMVYMRSGSNGFDNGIPLAGTSVEIELPAYDTVYSFRVTAVNVGGESFPSETLSAGINSTSNDIVLIVNGFDRISGPAWFDRDGMAGVAWWDDRGVADHYNIISTGDQYDFERNSPWTDDDNAGWGASYSDDEGRVIPGNTFDFTYVHGESILSAGRSFISVSDEVFTGEDFNLQPWCAVDLLFGEEKTTASVFDPGQKEFRIYTPEFLNSLDRLQKASLPVFMSGSYPGTDLTMMSDTSALARIKRTLHFMPRTGHAVRTGELYATDIAAPDFSGSYSFNTGGLDEIYAAEAPDAIEPAGKQSFTSFRYSENNTSAAVMHNGSVRTFVMGFPFETILSKGERDVLMKQILDFLLNK